MKKLFFLSLVAALGIVLTGCSLYPSYAPATPAPVSETPSAQEPTNPNVTPQTTPSAPGQSMDTPVSSPAVAPAAPDAGQAAKPAAVQNIQVAIRNFAFDQSTITIPVGSTVTWTNYDAVGHTATADNLLFDSPLLGQGQSYSFTFNSPGSYGYYCRPHPRMRGTIIVQ